MSVTIMVIIGGAFVALAALFLRFVSGPTSGAPRARAPDGNNASSTGGEPMSWDSGDAGDNSCGDDGEFGDSGGADCGGGDGGGD